MKPTKHIRCNHCKVIIPLDTGYSLKYCKCKKVACDGGPVNKKSHYNRIIGNDGDWKYVKNPITKCIQCGINLHNFKWCSIDCKKEFYKEQYLNSGLAMGLEHEYKVEMKRARKKLIVILKKEKGIVDWVRREQNERKRKNR